MIETSMPASAAPPDQRGFIRSAFRQFWQALLLQEDPYRPMLKAEKPALQGFKLLTVLYLTVGVITSLGLVVHYLTMPRLDIIQQGLFDFLQNLRFYQQWVAQGSLWTLIFDVAYRLVWFFISFQTGYPSRTDIWLTPFSMWMLGVFNWYTFAIFGTLLARKLGGHSKKHAFYGALAVANAPQLFLIFNLVPGLYVPLGLVTTWTMLTSYQAARVIYPQLTWKRTLVVVIFMYALHYLFIFLAFVLGIVAGVVFYRMLF
jgi:hypothetical protein